MIFTISVTSQVTNHGSPLSWKLLSDQDQIAAKALPSFDLEQVTQIQIYRLAYPRQYLRLSQPWGLVYKFLLLLALGVNKH